ncbi:hypothetical protein [Nocardia sp. NBC_00416]
MPRRAQGAGSGARREVLAALPLPISSITRVGNLRQRRDLWQLAR